MRDCENQNCTPNGRSYIYPNADPPGAYCGGCSVVSYCSKRCQKQDWPRHKLECVALKAEAEANRVPAEQVVGPEAAAAEAAARGRERPRLRRTQCGLCGGRKPPFEITECCGRVVCSDRDNYVLMSYGRNSCARNHDRYTICATHFNEEHSGQWQDCQRCRSNFSDYNYWTFASNHPDQPSRCNFPDAVPDIPWPSLPKCAVCGREVDTATEAHSYGPRGFCCGTCGRAW